MIILKWLESFGSYLMLMGRTFSRPERMRMFLKQYIKEIIDEELHCKFYENSWNLRPFELISEGLIMTYAPHKLISILNEFPYYYLTYRT